VGLQDVAEALRRLPEDVVVARNCRLKRAMDLSMKGIKLPYDLQEKQTPFEYYLQVRHVALGWCSLPHLTRF
jgi:ubiquinol-cytochrome c reductase subunit 7